MAWTAMPTFVPGPLLAAQLNVLINNISESAAAKATTAGRIFVATGANALAERAILSATVAASQTTTSIASFGDLATSGPTVTLTTGTQAVALVNSQVENSVGGGGGMIGVAVSGASSVAATVIVRQMSEVAASKHTVSGHIHFTGLTGGSNTFKAVYTTPTGGTASFANRMITVIGL